MSLRDKFKATATDTLKKQGEAELASSGERNFFKIKEGSNKFRILPKHPDEVSFAYRRVVHWIDCPFEDKDGEVEWKRGTIPNAQVHSNMTVDPFESYISIAKDILKERGDEESADQIKTMLHWKTGILGKDGWLMYVLDLKSQELEKIGLLEVGKAVRKGLNEEAIIEDEDEALELDPFTDPDEGKPVLITYKPSAQVADKYKVKLLTASSPISDEVLEKLEQMKPLSKTVRYDLTIFRYAIKALKNYDEENLIDIWSDPRWEETLQKLQKEANKHLEVSDPGHEVADDGDDLPFKKKKGDEFDDMDLRGLKKYVIKNKLKDVLKPKKTWDEDEFRNAIREYLLSLETEDAEEDAEVDALFEGDEETEDAKEETEEPDLEALKKKLKAMK